LEPKSDALEWERDYIIGRRLTGSKATSGDRTGDLSSFKLSPASDPVGALDILKAVEHCSVRTSTLSGGVIAPEKCSNWTILRSVRKAILRRLISTSAESGCVITSGNIWKLTEDFQRASESLARVIPDYLSQHEDTAAETRGIAHSAD